MVDRAPQTSGLLFEQAHPRRGLARINQRRGAAFEKFRHFVRIRRYTAHALQIVERRALS